MSVRLGIIGIGNIGTMHAKKLVQDGGIPNVVLAAMCDKNPAREQWVKENTPDAAFFADAESMYTSGLIDAVLVATPHYDHPAQAIAAMKHNLHVLVEKPAGVYTKQVKEMNAFADTKPELVFALMYNQRTNSLYKKVKEIVESGQLGRLRRNVWIVTNWYRSQFYYDSGDWRATWSGEGGGVLINQCPHNLDLWQWIVGMPTKITAHCHEGKWHDIEVEDDVTAYVEYADGSSGVFITSTGDVPGSNRFEITGDNGKLICEDNKITFYKLKVSEPEWTKTNDKSFGSPEYDVLEIEHEGTWPDHPAVIEAFGAKILGKGDLIADGREGINGLSISNAMHLSSWTGKTVSLPVDENAYHGELMKRVKTSRRKETGVSILAE